MDSTRQPITGLVPRVEAQTSHQAFVETVEPAAVMLSVIHARRLVKAGKTAASWSPPGTRVITTTTMADDHLARTSWDEEVEIVRAFDPAIHIPRDHPVYLDAPAAERRERAETCARGSLWVGNQLRKADADVALIPLVKGEEQRQLELGYGVAEEFGASQVAVYATQYFTEGGGVSRLRQKLVRLDQTAPYSVIVIGLLSAAPGYLPALPSNVVAAAGLRQWREAVEPRTRSAAEMRTAYDQFEQEVAAALGEGEGE